MIKTLQTTHKGIHMKIKEVISIIDKMLKSGIDELFEHAKTLVGPRRRGSLSDTGLESFDPELELQLVETQSNGVRVYQTEHDNKEFNGRIGVMSLKDALRHNQVGVRLGPHGPEMYIILNECWSTPKTFDTELLTVIVGPDKDLSPHEDVIHTWFPGPAYERASIPLGAAVKLT